jgi:hypothetical protein
VGVFHFVVQVTLQKFYGTSPADALSYAWVIWFLRMFINSLRRGSFYFNQYNLHMKNLKIRGYDVTLLRAVCGMKHYLIQAKSSTKDFSRSRASKRGTNATPWRLAWNALPYLFLRTVQFAPHFALLHYQAGAYFRCQMCDVGQRILQACSIKILSEKTKATILSMRSELIDEVKAFHPYIQHHVNRTTSV